MTLEKRDAHAAQRAVPCDTRAVHATSDDHDVDIGAPPESVGSGWVSGGRHQGIGRYFNTSAPAYRLVSGQLGPSRRTPLSKSPRRLSARLRLAASFGVVGFALVATRTALGEPEKPASGSEALPVAPGIGAPEVVGSDSVAWQVAEDAGGFVVRGELAPGAELDVWIRPRGGLYAGRRLPLAGLHRATLHSYRLALGSLVASRP